jgi:putative transposase
MATILRSYRTELDLSNGQRAACLPNAGVARWAYTYGFARQREAYARRQTAIDPKSVKILTAIDLHSAIIAIKQVEKPWLRDVAKWTPEHALRNLHKAVERLFKRQYTFPHYKKRSKRIGSHSLETPMHVGVDWIQGPVIGKARLFERRFLPQDCELASPVRRAKEERRRMRRDVSSARKYQSVVVSEQARRWFVSLLVEETVREPAPATGAPCGVDRGIKTLAVCLDGQEVANPQALRRSPVKQKRVQRRHSRRMSRRMKGGQHR